MGTVTSARAISGTHRQYLNDHAISDEVIAAAGIWSEGDQVVFPWKDGDLLTLQRRTWPDPADAAPAVKGVKNGKYLWEAGEKLHLSALRPARDDNGPVIIAEGTKQSLTVATYAPPGYAVYGMAGCWGWKRLGLTRLDRFAGRQVLIMLDADAASNLDVYEAGENLAAELASDGATPVFVPFPAQGKEGIDDYLAVVQPETRRAAKLEMLIEQALARPEKLRGKPAERRPARRNQPDELPDTQGLPLVVVNKNRREVVHEILHHMRMAFQDRLFCYGGVLARLRETTTEPLDRDSFTRWMAEAVDTYKYRAPTPSTPGAYEAAWPEPQTIGALLASGEEFPPLTQVSRTPFVRPDGTICFKNGYDWDPETGAGTQAMLVTGNSGMDRLDIPDIPARDQAAAAAGYLLDTWLGPAGNKRGMPWPDAASRANTLALILTPFIRGIVPLVPLAVISGLQPGVGKNLLADCISLMVSGENVQPLPWIPDDDDEIRKQILSSFRAGSSLVCFDEAHVIGGAALTRAITATTYSDRILGVSKMASYPNKVTWMSLGNQVTPLADMARRAYFIDLWPEDPDPQDRPVSAFKHADIRSWTLENRPELVTAALMMIRAWFAAECPRFDRESSMGSFETWDKMMSGILGYAGVPGFLEGLTERRAERDTTSGFWTEHLAWLLASFGMSTFTALDVKTKAMASGGAWDAPPRLDEPGDKGFTRNLGLAYSHNQNRWFGNLRLVKIGVGHGTKGLWQVQSQDSDQSAKLLHPLHPGDNTLGEQGGMKGMKQETSSGSSPAFQQAYEGDEGDELSTPYVHVRVHARTRDHAHTREGGGVPSASSASSTGLVVRADLETAEADRLYLAPRGEFVRLAGIIGPNGQPQIAPVEDVIAMLDIADRVDGHNFTGFDGPALAHHYPDLVDWNRLAPKIRDSELIARQVKPPRSREAGHSADKYGLDAVAGEMGLPGKTDDLKRLARKHGGYGMIPPEDPEYQDYLRGDLLATAAVSDHLMPYYDSDPYLPREHLLAQIAGQMSLNGFKVDQALLAERKARVDRAKADAVQALHDGWGLPLSKTVTKGRGAAKHDEEEFFISPLASGPGKAWLAAQFGRYQVPDPPRTPKSGELATGADELRPILEDPRCPASLREMLVLMETVTTARTVYQTAAECLAPDGRVHPFVSMRQASGRWSVTNPGLTVFGKREGKHVERDIFTADDEDSVILSCDLSQVDMRAMAGHCQDPGYMALFGWDENGVPLDPHSMIAEQVFGTASRRQDAKAVGHGWNYGLGAPRMIREGLDPEKVWGFVNGMEARFPGLIAWREVIREMGKAGQVLDNGFGRRMMAEPSRAYTVAPALMGQGGARDIMCESLLRLPRELWPFLRVMVHDEVVLSVPRWAAEEIGHILKEAMTWTWKGVPVMCDLSKPGRSWGSVSAK